MAEETLTETGAPPAAAKPKRRWFRVRFGPIALALIAALLLYYLGGAVWLHTVDADLDFGLETELPEGASRAVDVSVQLIGREVDDHEWVANDPFFLPGVLLDNMPNFQQGIIDTLSRFAIELTDQIARTRGSSQVDRDLEQASGLLKYPGNVWIFDLSSSLAPTASSESQYRRAMTALRSYNERLGTGDAVFERRGDNLLATIERFTSDLGSASAAVDLKVTSAPAFMPDFLADDLFYRNKGRLYGYYLLLRALGQDFADVLADRDLESSWQLLLRSLRTAAGLHPWMVVNGAPDSQVLPSHLTAQGFYLLRARTQLKEIANILLK